MNDLLASIHSSASTYSSAPAQDPDYSVALPSQEALCRPPKVGCLDDSSMGGAAHMDIASTAQENHIQQIDAGYWHTNANDPNCNYMGPLSYQIDDSYLNHNPGIDKIAINAKIHHCPDQMLVVDDQHHLEPPEFFIDSGYQLNDPTAHDLFMNDHWGVGIG
ncbi:MAG: hypothetical protein Q9179_007983 [Wetmoreana sp. 5 TL-2023]